MVVVGGVEVVLVVVVDVGGVVEVDDVAPVVLAATKSKCPWWRSGIE